jgi:RHH-type proline utilization regulon transcriptional repressor/proline dehydrogenase/delta 1-pyrroline-5-carboxylate dehydrogenase
VILRLDAADAIAIEHAQLAAKVCGVRLVTSVATDEPELEFIRRFPSLARDAEFLRTVSPPSDAILKAAYSAGLNWIDAPILTHGRLELPRWLREQSVSETRHRYGQLLPVSRDQRSEAQSTAFFRSI